MKVFNLYMQDSTNMEKDMGMVNLKMKEVSKREYGKMMSQFIQMSIDNLYIYKILIFI